MTLQKVAKAVEAIGCLARSLEFDALQEAAERALEALYRETGKSVSDRIARLGAISPPSQIPPEYEKTIYILTQLHDIVYMCDPKVAGQATIEQSRSIMTIAARNPQLLDYVEERPSDVSAVIEEYVAKFTDGSLAIDPFYACVETFMVDGRLNADAQREVVERVTGAPRRRLGNKSARRNELRSWRQRQEDPDWVFHARASKRTRF